MPFMNMNNLQTIMGRMASHAGSIPPTLIAVTKNVPLAHLHSLSSIGIHHVGESRIQETQKKKPFLVSQKLTWHMIGPLQSNKASLLVSLFDVWHSLDSLKTASAVHTACQNQKKKISCFLQINIGKEKQKGGIALHDALSFLNEVKQFSTLSVIGLMCIPPRGQDPSPFFSTLQKEAQRLCLMKKIQAPLLSMGMSSDYDVALQFGATHLRIGRSLFSPSSLSS